MAAKTSRNDYFVTVTLCIRGDVKRGVVGTGCSLITRHGIVDSTSPAALASW